MARPKSKPKTQTSKPKRRSLWPLTPRNETFERSGSLRLASPPASWDSASAAEPLTNNSPMAAMALFRALQPCDQALLSQVCIDDPPAPIDLLCHEPKNSNWNTARPGAIGQTEP